jgi:hypothetical protein
MSRSATGGSFAGEHNTLSVLSMVQLVLKLCRVDADTLCDERRCGRTPCAPPEP